MLLPYPRTFLAALAAALASMTTDGAESHRPVPQPITVRRTAFRGWSDALLLGNGLVEAVVVPGIGRVMQFRFVGESGGPLWINPALAGRTREPAARDWANFGGDKAWPSPQEDWARQAGRAWPPPLEFDGEPMTAEPDASGVTLVSAVGPHFGIRVRRRIELAAARPVMTITTTFEKVSGPPVEAGVWTVTQAGDPVLVGAELAAIRDAGAAYVLSSETPPAGLNVAGRLVTLTRSARENTKIGLRAGTLVWVGSREVLRISAGRVPGAKYPERGSSAQLYTNADPLPYVELECFGPLARLAPGDRRELTVTYTLLHRTGGDPAADLRAALPP